MSTVAVTPVFAAGNTATMSFDYCYKSDTERETPFVFAKIRKDKTKMLEESTKDLNINQGIWVDIFFLVNACKSSFGPKFKTPLFRLISP